MLEILDVSGNSLTKVRSIPEAMEFVKTAGVPADQLYIPNLDAEHPLPPSLRNVAPMMPEFPHELNPTVDQVYGQNSLRSKWIKTWNKFDINQSDAWVATEAKLVSIDETYGTGFRNLFTSIRDASRQMHNHMINLDKDPRMIKIKAAHAAIGSQVAREAVTGALEAKTITTILSDNGLIEGGKVRPEALGIAEWFQQNGTDPRYILRYRTQLHLAQRDAQKAIAETGALTIQKEIDKMIRDMHNGDVNITQEVIAQRQAQLQGDLVTRIQNFKNEPVYAKAIQRIQKQYPDFKTPEFKHGLNLLEDLFTRSDVNPQTGQVSSGGLHVLGVTEIYQRLLDPELNFDMDDFMTHHKFTPQQKELASRLKQYYFDEFTNRGIGRSAGNNSINAVINPNGKVADVGVARIWQYAPRMRTLGLELSDNAVFSEFAGTSLSEHTRNFVSMMSRIGELDNYVHDPLQAAQLWNRAYAKYKFLYPEIPKVAKALEQAKGVMSSQNAYLTAKNELESFIDRNLGKPQLPVRAAHDVYVKSLRDAGLKDNEILDRIQGASMSDVLVTYMNANILGARPDQALRDLYDATRKYFVIFGGRSGKFAKNFVSISTKGLDDSMMKRFNELKKNGSIRPADYVSMYNPLSNTDPTFTPGDTRARLGTAASEFSELAFKTSMQGPVYERVQAAAFLETYDTAHPALSKFIKGEINDKQLRKEVQLARYDIPQQERFLALAKAGKHNEAASYLAQETAHLISGSFATGNIAPKQGFFAKLYGQLQTWSLANRSPMLKVMARGEDAVDVLGINARLGITEVANLAFGAYTGMNTARYANIPVASFFITGGPMGNALNTAVQSATAAVTGGDAGQRRALSDMSAYVNTLIPFGYAAQMASDTYEELQDNDPGHAFARAVLGVKPKRKDANTEPLWKKFTGR